MLQTLDAPQTETASGNGAPDVALVGGQWGQNIGNAFFNLGGRYVLERALGAERIGYIQDQPNYRTLHHKLKGNPKHFADVLRDLDVTHVVLQGPVLNAWMRISWEETFRALRARGVRIVLLSCAFFKFTPGETASVRSFLEEFPPALIATRDARTHEILSDWLPQVPKFNGIDSGFYLNRCVNPFVQRADLRTMVMTFDRYPEPALSDRPPGARGHRVREIEIDGRPIWLSVPGWLDRAAHRGKIRAYFADLADRRALGADWHGRRIVRPEHRFFPHVTHKIYRRPNGIASDEPWTHLTIYANADLTLSDRVHACVAALGYGRQAMLFTPSPRSALFDRVGLAGIRQGLVRLDPARLEEEQERQIAWLRAHV